MAQNSTTAYSAYRSCPIIPAKPTAASMRPNLRPPEKTRQTAKPAVHWPHWPTATDAPESRPATAIQASAPLRFRKRSATKTMMAATATTTPGRITVTVLLSAI